jgi:hypothetical protein
MAYVEHRERSKGDRYRGFYKDTDGRYKSAGTYDTEERAVAVAEAAEKHAALIGGAAGGLDPITRATRTVEEYEPIFLRHHRVEGNTKDIYTDTLRLHIVPFLGKVRLAETDRTVARNYFTALKKAGRTPNRIRQAKVVVQAMYTMVVSEGYLDANPLPRHQDTPGTRPPGDQGRHHRPIPEDPRLPAHPHGQAVLHPAGPSGRRARGAFGDASSGHVREAAAYWLGPGLVSPLSSRSMAGVSAASICWNITRACWSRTLARVVRPASASQRPWPASAWASSQGLPIARASSRA